MGVGSRVDSDLVVAGNLAPTTFSPPAGCITNAAVVAGAGISATKVQHQHRQRFSQPNTTATTETRILHVVYGATGTVVAFSAGSIVACIGAATITFDLKKNGTTILTAVITLDNANTARVVEAGTLTGGNAVVAGDVLETVITATAGGGTIGTGAFCAVTVNEDPA